jgi:Fur family zinc uptake transcriptional regulator
VDRDARRRVRGARRATIARPRPTTSPKPSANARGKRVAANSVYRILDLFVRTNLANRVESANAYLANTHPGCRTTASS